MNIHKKYFISKEYKKEDLDAPVDNVINSSTEHTVRIDSHELQKKYEDLFKEFTMRKLYFPPLQKAAQRPALFPFSDIHALDPSSGHNKGRKAVQVYA